MTTIEIPKHLHILGTEAKRLRTRLREVMHASRPTPVKPRRTPFDTFARHTVQRAENDMAIVEYLFSGPIVRLGQRPRVRTGKALRITHALERVLDDLIGLWHGIDARTVNFEHCPEQRLLAAGLRKLLEQVDDLLRCLVDRINYPHLYLLPHPGPSSEVPPLLALRVELRLPRELRPFATRRQLDIAVATPNARHSPDFRAALGYIILGAVLGVALWDNSET